MKNRLIQITGSKTESLLACFGRARLVSLADGSVELRDSRPGDETAVKEWVSLFMHEAVPRFRTSE